ncbi:hypothetical protein N6L24_00555 [Cognatishimia sp. SS12]|uniref:hypothetical protein n=1 Tax=Cognatishimia sp. SS12 TaxID=2979465 RepID=UPI00232B91B5|nr:hypothetical protein [Cognatishimia sp. SS12]MDC0736756.1 hypothetical protein [Cognatishimia sp. SS12]
MVYNDTMGSLGRSLGPAARESERQEKDRQKRAMERSNAKYIHELDSYIRHITGLHHELIAPIDWKGLAGRPAPQPPEIDLQNSQRMRSQLAHHEPGFVEWLMGRGKQTRDALERALHIAKQRNHDDILVQLTPYHRQVAQWEREQATYHGVMQGDDAVLLSVIKSQQTLSKIHKLGRGLGFSVNGGLIHAVLSLHDQSIVPDFHLKYMPSGKLTELKMPREKSMRLYRAYAASATLKVASDLFRLVPADVLVVSCIAPCHVTESAYDEDWPVLSAAFKRDRFEQVDLPNIEALPALSRFKVAEAFHPTHGFGRIAPIIDIPARMAV